MVGAGWDCFLGGSAKEVLTAAVSYLLGQRALHKFSIWVVVKLVISPCLGGEAHHLQLKACLLGRKSC